MELLKVDWFPVVDKDGHVVGVVDQSRLTASLILDVSNLSQQAQQPVKRNQAAQMMRASATSVAKAARLPPRPQEKDRPQGRSSVLMRRW
jgi:hypothetical protein